MERFLVHRGSCMYLGGVGVVLMVKLFLLFFVLSCFTIYWFPLVSLFYSMVL